LVRGFPSSGASISDAQLPCSPFAEQNMAMPVTRHWATDDVRALMREDRAWPGYELIDGEPVRRTRCDHRRPSGRIAW